MESVGPTVPSVEEMGETEDGDYPWQEIVALLMAAPSAGTAEERCERYLQSVHEVRSLHVIFREHMEWLLVHAWDFRMTAEAMRSMGRNAGSTVTLARASLEYSAKGRYILQNAEDPAVVAELLVGQTDRCIFNAFSALYEEKGALFASEKTREALEEFLAAGIKPLGIPVQTDLIASLFPESETGWPSKMWYRLFSAHPHADLNPCLAVQGEERILESMAVDFATAGFYKFLATFLEYKGTSESDRYAAIFLEKAKSLIAVGKN